VPEDVRLTTRFRDDEFVQSLMGTIHETGHGRYEQNLPRELLGQPVAEARSMAIHESQSLSFEMQLGRSHAFAGLLVIVLAIFFQRTRIGRALRAVADDHQAALSVGIPLRHIWVIVWGVAGLVALVAGIIWGSKLGVQFSIALVALKALPVLMLGGLTSVPGAIVGGLIVGAGEKLAEAYLGPLIGGGIEYWFAFVLALAVLLVRPQGVFGERIIERI